MSEHAILLETLPTREAAFHARVADSDFLYRYSADPKGFWPDYSKHVGTPLATLASRARASGVRVVEDAKLADLANATATAELVVLVSHWKGPHVRDSDLLDEHIDGWGSCADESTDPPAAWLHERFDRSPPRNRSDLVAALQAYVTRENGLTETAPDGYTIAATPFTIESRNRDALDRLFAGRLRPGNSIEFADGMHDKDAVLSAVDQSFCGILDLTTCTSTYVSDHLSREARGRYVTVQFDCKQEPDIACVLLERTFDLYADGVDYLAARRQARDEFTEAIDDGKMTAQVGMGLLSRMFAAMRRGR